MSTTQLFIEPLDVLFLRGNKLFGDSGSYGESLVPPWPSVAAGAIRSALLVHKNIDLARFGRGEIVDPELGTPQAPGSFTITAFQLARRYADGRTERLYALPADVSVIEATAGDIEIRTIKPQPPAGGIDSSAATSSWAVLPEPQRGKATTGCWLTNDGWLAHLQGKWVDGKNHVVRDKALWKRDTRVGIGLDPATRSVSEGKLFTSTAVALTKCEHASDGKGFDVGFLAEVSGAKLPDDLPLRFGGDGRGAFAHCVTTSSTEPDYAAIANAKRCRLILTAPGLFAHGWLPTGTTLRSGEPRFNLHGVTGRIVCAAVPRFDVISGFDLASWQPKPAERAAPTGSVYWLDDLQLAPEATGTLADALRKLAEQGLWESSQHNTARRAEGFNRVAVGC